MYNFNLEKDENIISIFDDVLVKNKDNQKLFSVAVTNKRFLILDYQGNELMDTLKGSQASFYIKIKDVIFYRYLNQIKELKEGRLYKIIFDDDYTLEFDDQELYTIIMKVKSL